MLEEVRIFSIVIGGKGEILSGEILANGDLSLNLRVNN